MVDLLPFLQVKGNTSEEKINEIIAYLTQFKEELEFILTNISRDNLSPELVRHIDKLEEDIKKSNADREDEITQISSAVKSSN
jgi:hypothetical protein